MGNKKITLEVPIFDRSFNFKWYEGAKLCTEFNNGEFIIKGNKSGLLSLANHLINLCQDEVPEEYHFHLDEFNSLEKGSIGLQVEKDNHLF